MNKNKLVYLIILPFENEETALDFAKTRLKNNAIRIIKMTEQQFESIFGENKFSVGQLLQTIELYQKPKTQPYQI